MKTAPLRAIQVQAFAVQEAIPPSPTSKVDSSPVADAASLPPVAYAAPLPPVADAAPLPPVADAAPLSPVADAAPLPPVADAAPLSPVADAAPREACSIHESCPSRTNVIAPYQVPTYTTSAHRALHLASIATTSSGSAAKTIHRPV